MLYKFTKEVIVEADSDQEAWDIIAEYEANEQGVFEWLMDEVNPLDKENFND
jgi:hypothetical protein